MKNKNIINFSLSGGVFLLFIIFTFVVKFADVVAIGPNESVVGLASLNMQIRDLIGYSETWLKISDIFGYIAIAVAVGFAVYGIISLIKNKSIKKVDTNLIILACFYVAVGIFYVLFELIVVNYRPVLIDGQLEASYPSSHTILALCIMASAIIMFDKLLLNKTVKMVAVISSVLVIAVTLLARVMSGVHWISDIIGGILLSTALIMTFDSTIEYFANRPTKAIDSQNIN